jgi:hypothetical protein
MKRPDESGFVNFPAFGQIGFDQRGFTVDGGQAFEQITNDFG